MWVGAELRAVPGLTEKVGWPDFSGAQQRGDAYSELFETLGKVEWAPSSAG